MRASIFERTTELRRVYPQDILVTNANADACLRWLAGSPPNIEKACETVGRVVRDSKRAGERSLQEKRIKRQRLDMNEAIEEILALAQCEVRTKRVAPRTDLAARLPPVLDLTQTSRSKFLTPFTPPRARVWVWASRSAAPLCKITAGGGG